MKKLNKETNLLRNKSAAHTDIRPPGSKTVRMDPAISVASTLRTTEVKKEDQKKMPDPQDQPKQTQKATIQKIQSPKNLNQTQASRKGDLIDYKVPVAKRGTDQPQREEYPSEANVGFAHPAKPLSNRNEPELREYQTCKRPGYDPALKPPDPRYNKSK